MLLQLLECGKPQNLQWRDINKKKSTEKKKEYLTEISILMLKMLPIYIISNYGQYSVHKFEKSKFIPLTWIEYFHMGIFKSQKKNISIDNQTITDHSCLGIQLLKCLSTIENNDH